MLVCPFFQVDHVLLRHISLEAWRIWGSYGSNSRNIVVKRFNPSQLQCCFCAAPSTGSSSFRWLRGPSLRSSPAHTIGGQRLIRRSSWSRAEPWPLGNTCGCVEESQAHKVRLGNASHQADVTQSICAQMLRIRVHQFSFASISSAAGSLGAASASHQLPVHPLGLNSTAIHKVFKQNQAE